MEGYIMDGHKKRKVAKSWFSISFEKLLENSNTGIKKKSPDVLVERMVHGSNRQQS